jgi:hypothetical protein
MGGLLDRLPILLEEAEEDLPFLRDNAANVDKDKNGSASNVLSNTLRFTGVAVYAVNSDSVACKAFLQEAASIRLELIKRFNAGEKISESYVSMLSYKPLFNALASGDFKLARELAMVMGGREKIESEYDHPFDSSLGYALKALVLDASDQEEKIAQFNAIVNEPGNKDFVGYAEAFEAIQNKDVKQFVLALQAVILGHKNQCKGNGVFKGTEDEVLCVWGVGLVNLAKSKGLEAALDDPLIPASLTM